MLWLLTLPLVLNWVIPARLSLLWLQPGVFLLTYLPRLHHTTTETDSYLQDWLIYLHVCMFVVLHAASLMLTCSQHACFLAPSVEFFLFSLVLIHSVKCAFHFDEVTKITCTHPIHTWTSDGHLSPVCLLQHYIMFHHSAVYRYIQPASICYITSYNVVICIRQATT